MSARKGWISFNFEPTDDAQRKPPPEQSKRKASVWKKLSSEKNAKPLPVATSFYEAVEPVSVDELPVHAKKIAEVAGWLDQFVLKPSTRNALLLITGPTGCAKTATVNLLCRQKSIELVEWINPIDTLQFRDKFEPYLRQADRFLEFVLNSTYASLTSKCAHRVCLVKDFPNVFLQKPEEFHQLLEEVASNRNIKIIFVVTDHAASSLNIERNLFQDAIRMQHNIGTISFNACAATLMKKAATRVVQYFQRHPDTFDLPSANVIDAVCASSMGDIRCCVNQLYIAALKSVVVGQLPLAVKAVKAGSRRKQSAVLKTKLKDEALGLFHSIGRVLNPKVEPTTLKLQCDLDALVSQMSTHPMTIIQFLFQNYLNHFGAFEDVVRASEILSTVASFMHTLVDQHELPLTLAVMGLMLANKHKVSKWNPIRAPPKISNDNKLIAFEANAFLSSADHCYVRRINGGVFSRFASKTT